MPTLAAIAAHLQRRYPLRYAEPWDQVGLAVGDPTADVVRLLAVVDVTHATVDEAERIGAQAILAHHPLLLSGINAVTTDDYKGSLVYRLIRAGIGVYVAHTNADKAPGGVNDALAHRLGLTDLAPLVAASPEYEQVSVYVPVEAAGQVLDAMDAAAGEVWGDYRRAAWLADGVGTFVPGEGANPTIGHSGEITEVSETKIEMTIPASRRAAVLAALRSAHPYEVPAFHVSPSPVPPPDVGLGRIGSLSQPRSLRKFAADVAAALPQTASEIRVAGNLEAQIQQVAVCGGAGDSLLGQVAAAGVDAYVTADLRHHRVSEFRDGGGCALIDAGHWATERPWLDTAAELLRAEFGSALWVSASDVVTDPWSATVKAER